MGLLCAGKLSTLVGEGQFHGGGDAVGAAEHGLSCLVEVAACNKDEEESPTHWQLLCRSAGSQSMWDSKSGGGEGFLCRLLLRIVDGPPLLRFPNPQEALCHNWPHCYSSQSRRLSRQNLFSDSSTPLWCFALLGGR